MWLDLPAIEAALAQFAEIANDLKR